MVELKVVLVFVLSIFTWNYVYCDASGPLVTLKLGQVRGTYMKTLAGREFSAFRGIPYAKPPVGQLRFKPPEKLTEPWSSQPLDATKDGHPCYQYDGMARKLFGQEDCLVINVYTPEVPDGWIKPKGKDVMVFIHGGGFYFGEGSSTVYGPRRIMDHDVILVTFNYRLNLLGFLKTFDEASPGNCGLLDQLAALKWVRENIHSFGGDPTRVTLFGESAGSASVGYHMISELSKGLFSAAIRMSGSALSNWGVDNDPLGTAKKLATQVGCLKSSNIDMINCLRGLPIDDLMKPLTGWAANFTTPFRPLLDNNFITDYPMNLIKNGRIASRVPLMIGRTAIEGKFFRGLQYGDKIPKTSDKTIVNTISYCLNVDKKKAKKALELVKKRYFPDMDKYTTEGFQQKLIQMYTDAMMATPIHYDLELVVKYGFKPYVYSYDYVTDHSCAKSFGFDAHGKPTHVDDMYFLFDSAMFPESVKKLNDVNENRFLQLFINFAKTRDPNLRKEDKVVKWIPADESNLPTYHLDDPLKLSEWQIDPEVTDLWVRQIPELVWQDKKGKEEL